MTWSFSSKAHDLVSRRVLVPLSRLQRTVRPSRRPAMLAYYEGMRTRGQAHNWDAERRREWVLNRLRSVVRRAYDETAYHRELFNRVGFDPASDFSFEDFAKLPVLERGDIHSSGQKMISRMLGPKQLKRDATGGSTGVPTEIWVGPEETGWRESSWEYFCQRAAVPMGTRTGLLWGHHLDPVASDGLRDRFYSYATNVRWFDCFRLSPEVLERYHQGFESWRPACIVAYATALASLAEHLMERKVRPAYPTRCLVTGAEKLLPHHRELIESVFDRPVHERYGSRDAGYIAFQMNPSRTLDLEVDWANMLVEPETADPDAAILITKLHADGMPMIRYRIGDLARFPEGSRPGNPAFALREVLGRDTERIWLSEGRWIHGIQIPHLMKDHPVRGFMLVQAADYSVEVQVVPNNGFGDESRRKILATLEANLPGLDVSLKLVEEIPRTRASKWRPVVSHVVPAQEKPLR